METSNFAHVIFQNVGKSYLPHAALECHYTLTQFITPNPKDWVGIFKVGWSTARDYYTFLWSPMPEELTEGTAINRSVVFQGYYVPNDDGEFYQFCYVSHKGEIRGASTPFQIRAGTPTEDELLAVEDDTHSDILVVTTRTSYLEQKLEEVRGQKEVLERSLQEVQQEKLQLEGAVEALQQQSREAQRDTEQLTHTLSQEQHACTQLRTQLQEVVEEREEVRRRQEESSVRLLQLEEDLIGVTQRGLQKETQLDSLKDRLKKLSLEKDNLESQLKNEKDEKELYKIHLKNRELENSKLGAELQMVKAVEVNRENSITQLRDEVARLKACLTDREQQNRHLLASPSAEMKALREQLRQKEEQLNASQQQGAMLGAELRDAASVRDRSMSELYRTRLETEQLRLEAEQLREEAGLLRKTHSAAQDECRRLEQQLQQQQEGEVCDVGALQELQREVEDLRLRLHMAAEHYKDKYKECQKLHKQVLKQEEKRSPEAAATPLTSSPEPSVPGSACGGEAALDTLIQSKLRSRDNATDKSDKYRKIKQMLSEEKERSCVFADELAKMEQKWREQLKTNDSLRIQMASEEDRYRSQVAAKGRELKDLKDKLAALTLEKERLEGDLQRSASHEEEEEGSGQEGEELEVAPVFLQYPLPYEPAPLMASDLQYGNPYTRDGADGDEFSDEMLPRLPPMGPPSWDSNVVCIQPARNLSRPDGLEEPEEQSSQPSPAEEPAPPEAPSTQLSDTPMPFCFEASGEQKRCPLCEVIFPPHYEQRRFEEHVESHWKVCPMCSEQFPLDCQQQLFEKHVLTHFDANVLNFE